jgi:uncharacterized protein
MTPEERKLVTDLFDRLATLEDAQRDPDAERLIRDGLRQAPNASYALVQTVLVQDEALKRADARIRQLEGTPDPDSAPSDTSFLGSVRDSLFGRREGRGSVPSVRPGDSAPGVSSAWRTGAPTAAPGLGSMPPGSMPPGPMASGPMGSPMGASPMGQPMGRGGSFLGTAAAAAAGVIGGSLLLDSIRSMTGHSTGAQAAFDPSGGASRGSPWDTGSSSGGDLSRQAGLDDIGRGGSSDPAGGGRNYGLFDDGPPNDVQADQDDDFDDGGFDGGGGSEDI